MTTMSKIKIKRSTTSGAPGTTLDAGELAYSGLSGTQSNGGDRLYVGINSTQVVIGGKYFTDMLDHVNGTLTANSAIIVDASKKIDYLKTTNLTFGGEAAAGYDSSIRSTGELSLEPASGSNVHISNAYTLPNVDGGADYVLTTHNDGTTSWEKPATKLTIDADTGSDVEIDLLSETLVIAGDGTASGIDTETDPSNNTIIIKARNASSSQKGVAKFVDTDFTVTAGSVELAVNVPQAFTADSGSTLTLTGNSLLIEGDATRGIETSTGTNKIHIQNKIATSAQLGVAKFSTSYFSVDGAGEVTSTLATASAAGVAYFPAANFDISNGEVSIKLATDSQVGVAKFDITNFDVSGTGKVTANAIFLGDTELNLGDATGTNTDLTGMVTIEVGDLKFENYKISTTVAATNLELAPTGLVKVKSYTLPGTNGSDGQALITNGAGQTNWTTIGKSLNISDDSSQTGNVDFLDETLAFLGDISGNAGAISTTVDDTTGAPTITIAARTANNSRTGIASFSSASFDVSAGGAVTIKSGGVTNTQLVNDSITFGTSEYFLGGNGAADDGFYDFVGMDYAEFSNITIGQSGDNNISGGGLSSIISKVGALVLVGNTAVQINSGSGQYTLPIDQGTADYVLATDGNGGTSWTQISTNLNIAGDNSNDGFNLINDTLTFVGDSGNGLGVEVSDGSYVTFTVADADYTSKGTASFDSLDFSVLTGAVSLVNAVVKKVKADSGTDVVTTGHELSILGTSSRGITTAATANTITVSADYASYTALGVAQFDSTNFTVVDGAVSSNDITFGSTSITLGGSTNNITGLTQIDVGNVSISGDTVSNVSGDLILNADSGEIDVSSNIIKNVADPVNPNDAANKKYVDATATGLDVKASVRVATTANVTLSGTQTIDGVSVVNGNRVLVRAQTTGSENGIYVVGTPWTRATDADNGTKVTSGMFTFVEEGTAWGDSGFILITNGTITVGTTALEFTQFSAAGQSIAGNGLTKSGDTIDVVGATNGGIQVNADSIQLDSGIFSDGLDYNTGTGILTVVGTTGRIVVTAAGVDIDSTYVGQTSIDTLGTVTTGTWEADTVAEIYGGTGQSTYNKGDILIASATNTLTRLAYGNDYQFLMLDPVSGLPVWADIDGGDY